MVKTMSENHGSAATTKRMTSRRMIRVVEGIGIREGRTAVTMTITWWPQVTLIDRMIGMTTGETIGRTVIGTTLGTVATINHDLREPPNCLTLNRSTPLATYILIPILRMEK
jgi:hypothetical protein